METHPQTTVTQYAHIVRTPGILAGEPRISGHRIRVRDVADIRDKGGYSPEEIASTIFPSLTLAQVYAALAYYEDHRAQIDALANEEQRTVEQFIHDHPELSNDSRPS
jgi:uncharacterized protein (DUF433 family)